MSRKDENTSNDSNTFFILLACGQIKKLLYIYLYSCSLKYKMELKKLILHPFFCYFKFFLFFFILGGRNLN